MDSDWDALPRCFAAGNGVQAEVAGEQKRRLQLLYVDEQHLTRDCIGRELARHLPDLSVVVRTEVKELELGGPCGSKFDVAIINVHADKIDITADREIIDRGRIVEGLSLLEQIAPETPRILLSDVEAPDDIIEAFQRRIRGYLPTTLPIGQVAEAIRFVLAGGTFVPQSILTKYRRAELPEYPQPEEDSSFVANFSPRQIEVLGRLWRGLSNKMIAYELNMCESTVKVHIRHIMKKLKVNNRTQVVLRTKRPTSGNALQFDRGDLRRALQVIAITDPIPIERAGASGDRNVVLLNK
jgi:DNA-binding NarL/FixJ family response regulator